MSRQPPVSLPIHRSVVLVRVIVILAIDAVLLGTGIVFIRGWLATRDPAPSSPPAKATSETAPPPGDTPPEDVPRVAPEEATDEAEATDEEETAVEAVAPVPDARVKSAGVDAAVREGVRRPDAAGVRPVADAGMADALVITEVEPDTTPEPEPPAIGVADLRAAIPRGAVRDCAAAAPDLAGDVTIHLQVEPSGAVTVSLVANGTGSDELGLCLMSALSSAPYPTPPVTLELDEHFSFGTPPEEP